MRYVNMLKSVKPKKKFSHFTVLWLFTLLNSFRTIVSDKNEGYIVYCPCMGRLGNQVDHFLGALAFSKGINRTLILPHWVEYRYGEPRSFQIPFDAYFRVDVLSEYHRVITMDNFMTSVANMIWPKNKRVAFCYTPRIGETENSCNAKSGNPFGPFWDTYQIDFVASEFYGPLNYNAHNKEMMANWQIKYPIDRWSVLAFTGAPASFPVQDGNQHLQKYLQFNDDIVHNSKQFIKKYMPGSFLGVHLRNGRDWETACEHVKDSPTLFAAPQCVGYRNENGPLTKAMCFPSNSQIIKQIGKAVKKIKDLEYVFIASDANHMQNEINNALVAQGIKIVKLNSSNPHLDLSILSRANYFIGNCVSSFTAFVKRARDVAGLPSEFWSFPLYKKIKHEDL